MAVPADVTFDLQKATTYFNHTTVGYINAYWKQPPANSEWANGIAWLDNATEDIADVGTTANAIANIQQEILSAIVALKKTTVGMKNKKWKVPPSNSQWYVAITHINQAKVLTQKIGGFQEYDDANQVNAVAHISADEEFNGALIDAAQISGVAFISASEFYTPGGGSNNYSDPGTVGGHAVVSGVDKMLPFKDAATVTAHGVITAVETYNTAWSVAAPGSTDLAVTTITDAESIALNINNQTGGSYHDYVIDGGGDSSVLLQGTTNGVLLQRFHITRPDAIPFSGNPSSPASHGVYCKAFGNTFEDFYMDNTDGNGANGFSVRMGANVFNRFRITGFPAWSNYFEHDGVARPTPVTYYQGYGEFSQGAAFYGDDSNGPPSPGLKQAFQFTQIDMVGNSNLILNLVNYIGAGFTFDTCTINGTKIIPSMAGNSTYFRGITSGLITIR